MKAHQIFYNFLVLNLLKILSVFPNKILPFHSLPLNSQRAISLGVFGFGTEMSVLFAASRFLQIVLYLITVFASLGVCLEPLRPCCFHSYHSGSGHCCLTPGPSSGLLAAPPSSSCSVSHRCRLSCLPATETLSC